MLLFHLTLLACSWEKNHFLRKWAFPEMDGNHFFPENARQPPDYVHDVYARAFASKRDARLFLIRSENQ